MNQRAKLISAIINNPRDVRFEDACKTAEMLGFTMRQRGTSHRVYSKASEPVGLNFQNRNGRISVYQAKQLIEMIRKHGDGW